MPNNVINEIHLRGSASAMLRLLNNCCEERGDDGIWRIDFCKIIPMPEGMEAVGDAYYDWCIPNWGTKWNAYEHEKPKFNPGNGYLRFQTAWAAPHQVVQGMSRKFPYVTIDHYWADEDIGKNCGHRKYLGGKIFEECIVLGEKDEDSAKFAELLWEGEDDRES